MHFSVIVFCILIHKKLINTAVVLNSFVFILAKYSQIYPQKNFLSFVFVKTNFSKAKGY